MTTSRSIESRSMVGAAGTAMRLGTTNMTTKKSNRLKPTIGPRANSKVLAVSLPFFLSLFPIKATRTDAMTGGMAIQKSIHFSLSARLEGSCGVVTVEVVKVIIGDAARLTVGETVEVITIGMAVRVIVGEIAGVAEGKTVEVAVDETVRAAAGVAVATIIRIMKKQMNAIITACECRFAKFR